MHYPGVVAQLANWFGEFILTICGGATLPSEGQILPNGQPGVIRLLPVRPPFTANGRSRSPTERLMVPAQTRASVMCGSSDLGEADRAAGLAVYLSRTRRRRFRQL